MIEPDLEKCYQELDDLRLLPPISIEIPVIAAMAIISCIQLATRKPIVRDSEFAKMAIDVAKELQQSLDPNTENYKLLEIGWELHAEFGQVEVLREKILKIFSQDFFSNQI